MARTIRGLRADGQLAAVVDLTQIGARGESTEAGRWFYSIAYRIVRELRIKVDLQSWWQEKSVLLREQRLSEFFWEIVLANTTAPVTIFFDEIERALDLPYAGELFAALSNCYNSRATEPDYQRLNFVVMGVATPRQLGRGVTLPLFLDGLAIEPQDFTLEETYGLVEGFDTGEEQAQAALNRVRYWAKGQPYLTQKISRAVARRGGNADDVDSIVRSQFLTQGARDEEPLLNHVAGQLTGGGPHKRRALILLKKLGKGTPIVADIESPAQAALRLSGIAANRDEEFLTYRNRLVKSVFTSRWASSALPFDWRGAAVAAVAVLVMILLPVWYTKYFPRPYIDTLTAVTNNYAVALDTHDKLRRFPGFGSTADELLADIMIRRSRTAETYSEVRAADDVLRSLDGYTETADELMGAYWLQRAESAVLSGRRDEALVYADLAQIGSSAAAADLASSLIDSDYPHLLRTHRFDGSLLQWEIDWDSQGLTVVDTLRQGRLLSLTAPGSSAYTQALTALQHVPVSRELGIDEPGSAGAFQLQIDVEHEAEEQVMLMLEAPSGASVTFGLPPSSRSSRVMQVTEQSALSSLADEDRRGVWRLTLIDRVQGQIGRLNRWGLLFAEELRGWEDVPDQGLEIPDPVRTDQIDVQLSLDGRLGLARPSRPGARGALTLWDLESGSSLGDLQLDTLPSYSLLSPDARRLVTVTGNALTIWDVDGRSAVARIVTQTGFALPPAVSVDGQYVAIAEHLETGAVLYSLLRAQDGELVASIEGITDARDWVLGPQARYLIVLGPGRLAQLLDPRRGELILKLPHSRELVRFVATADDLLLSVDVAGDILVWHLSDAQQGDLDPQLVGITVDPQSVSIAGDGSVVAYEAENSHVIVRDIVNDTIALSARVHRAGGPVRTRLAPDGQMVVTASGALLQIWEVTPAPPVRLVNVGVSVMALDETAQIAALGYRDGHVQIRTTAQLQERIETQREIPYIGHQGAVTSIAVSSARGLIASGGRDGVVRLWSLTSGAPTEPFMRHPDGPIHDVAISDDGQWVISAAETSAMAWATQDGELAVEFPINGSALAVSIAPDSSTVAVGDSAGNVFVAAIDDSSPPRSARAQAGVTALAFGPNGERLASGDRSGRVQLWSSDDARALGSALVLPHAIRWLGFGADGDALIVQTDHWVHRLAIEPAGPVVAASWLVGVDVEEGVPTAPDGESLRLIGGRDLGLVDVEEISVLSAEDRIDLSAPQALNRDWIGVLGLAIDESAEVIDANR
jgi:WD40 repeat protein